MSDCAEYGMMTVDVQVGSSAGKMMFRERSIMPLVRVDIIKGKTPEYKKNLLNCIHEGLMETIGIEDWDRFQRIVEIDKVDYETSPDKTDDFMIIEITMFKGRTREQKKALIETVTDKLVETLEIRPTDVFIVIHEPADENWGLGGKQRKV